MRSINKYNKLDGKKYSRAYIKGVLTLAKKEGVSVIVKKLENLLKKHPKATSFELEIRNKIKNVGLSGVLGSSFKTPGQLTDEEFQGLKGMLPFVDESDIEPTGLNKAVSSNDIYDMITKKMTQMLKKATGSGYKKKWKGRVYGEGYTIPFNFVSKKRYRGVNHFLLTGFEPLKNPYYLTIKQIDKLKGKIKKGSLGHPVIYFTKLYVFEQEKPKLKFGTYDIKKMISFLKANINKISGFSINDVEYLAKKTYIPVLKYYNVFNGADIEGIDFDLDNFKIGYINNPLPPLEANKMDVPESIIRNYPKPQPTYRFGGDRAFYQLTDLVQMPYIVDFETAQDYYRTFFHEIAHSTGHAKRLKRNMMGNKGSKNYAFEELIAEWGAVFLSAEAGIIFHNNNNHAEYLKNWNRALTHAKDDNKFIMRACTQAQKASDFVLQPDKEGNPKYLKDIKPTKKVEPKEKKKKATTTKSKKVVKKLKNPKTTKKITPKKVSKEVIGYALVDNISGEIVASKRDLQQIQWFYEKNQNKEFKGMPILAYEIIKKGNKNVLGNKVELPTDSTQKFVDDLFNEVAKQEKKEKKLAISIRKVPG